MAKRKSVKRSAKKAAARGVKRPAELVALSPPEHVLRRTRKGEPRIFEKSAGKTEMRYEFDTIPVCERKTFFSWLKMYSPVLITAGIGLITYLYLVLYMFYPAAVEQGRYLSLLVVIIFLFVLAGILLFLGLRSELLFVRILSFIFVFVVFTFLLLFILVSYALTHKTV